MPRWGEIQIWFDGNGQRYKQKGAVDKMLTEPSVLSLIELGKYRKPDESPIISRFDTEQVVAYTQLTPIMDNNKRENICNHTILIHYDDVFRDYLKTVVTHFKPIEVEK